MKFSGLYEDTNVVSQYIYHINAQNPSGETAFAALNESLGWAARPLGNRLPALPNTVSVALLYGSSTWMDKEAGNTLKEVLGERATLDIIPRSGHHIYADNYRAFNDVVVQMLKEKQ
jgi:abhydrolase domain-containing protein 4